ncbi:MAG: sialate O-acetylesterase [Planctomycetaceae bacterium]
MRSIFLLTLCLAACTTAARATDYHVYYLGGQSNMDGYGFVRELTPEQAAPVAGVRIFHGNTSPDNAAIDGRGLWSELRTGHGVGFSSDGETNKYSERFGVELSFARSIQAAHPDQHIAIIKYSRGGTSIAIDAARHFGCWDPDYPAGAGAGQGINQYDHFLATIRHATAVRDIDGDGSDDRLIPAGILWMQGESDAAHTPETAAAYQANLKRLMDLIRAALREDDLPVAIGRISDSGRDPKDGKLWDHGDVVRAAQQSFVEQDGSAALVTSTDDYGYSDAAHYDTAGYLDLGAQFATAIDQLQAP